MGGSSINVSTYVHSQCSVSVKSNPQKCKLSEMNLPERLGFLRLSPSRAADIEMTGAAAIENFR